MTAVYCTTLKKLSKFHTVFMTFFVSLETAITVFVYKYEYELIGIIVLYLI